MNIGEYIFRKVAGAITCVRNFSVRFITYVLFQRKFLIKSHILNLKSSKIC